MKKRPVASPLLKCRINHDVELICGRNRDVSFHILWLLCVAACDGGGLEEGLRDTLFYAEYNTGPASSTSGRVRWKGFHVLNRASDASAFTVGSFIAGTAWLPGTGIPFNSGL
ncbi:hypothetical protein Bca52824_004171 [Brassica carinata]|uniref:Pectinesterase catalytic domain-containing protein n=1 Tax=Brassica carinata TaxID=52824 RepID=A0A8X7WNZ1_BRACI|nr:hypothetical protein Bca52824_004171 [Brassica carinata]